MLINSWLLVVVLFFVYPLKFIISFLLSYFKYLFLITFGFHYDREAFRYLVMEVSSWEMIPYSMMIYSIGYFALMLSFALFYRHTYRKRDILTLSILEVQKTYSILWSYYLQCIVSLLSVLLAFTSILTLVYWLALLAGFVYFFLGSMSWLLHRRLAKKFATVGSQS